MKEFPQRHYLKQLFSCHKELHTRETGVSPKNKNSEKSSEVSQMTNFPWPHLGRSLEQIDLSQGFLCIWIQVRHTPDSTWVNLMTSKLRCLPLADENFL